MNITESILKHKDNKGVSNKLLISLLKSNLKKIEENTKRGKFKDIIGDTMINLTESAKKPVTFEYYRDKCLWYSTHDGKIFPVPVEDAQSSTFNSTEKGILLMRWMRKWNEEQQET